jgi:hypothetical protein
VRQGNDAVPDNEILPHRLFGTWPLGAMQRDVPMHDGAFRRLFGTVVSQE